MAKPAAASVECVNGQVPRELWRRIGVIADWRGINRPDALQRYAAAAIDREYARVVELMKQDIGGES